MKTPMPTEAQMDAFRRGEEAYKRGAEKDANPFTAPNLEWMWACGWTSAQCDEAKLTTNSPGGNAGLTSREQCD